jgi:hypothetical protein
MRTCAITTLHFRIPRALPSAIVVLGLCLARTASPEESVSIDVTLKDHRFSPSEIHVATGKPSVLRRRRGLTRRFAAIPTPPSSPSKISFLFLLRRRSRVQQNVTLDANLLDQIKLTIEEVDVLFFVLENVHQQVAGDEVAHGLAIGDPLA